MHAESFKNEQPPYSLPASECRDRSSSLTLIQHADQKLTIPKYSARPPGQRLSDIDEADGVPPALRERPFIIANRLAIHRPVWKTFSGDATRRPCRTSRFKTWFSQGSLMTRIAMLFVLVGKHQFCLPASARKLDTILRNLWKQHPHFNYWKCCWSNWSAKRWAPEHLESHLVQHSWIFFPLPFLGFLSLASSFIIKIF